MPSSDYSTAGLLLADVPGEEHEAKRDVLTGHPPSDESRPLTGVFYTRSPARPNPLGLHPVVVREINGTRVKIGPIEVFDCTPVVDIKSASTRADG